jgi:hypothetical protein
MPWLESLNLMKMQGKMKKILNASDPSTDAMPKLDSLLKMLKKHRIKNDSEFKAL